MVEGCTSCSTAVEDSLRFSRHLQDGFTRTNTWTNGIPSGYTHTCICGGCHGSSSFSSQSLPQPPMNYQVTTTITHTGPPVPPLDEHECPPPDQSSPPEESLPTAKASSVRWNKASMLRHIHQAEKNESHAKQKLWTMNRFGKSGPRLDTFRMGSRIIPKKYQKHPHGPIHYCPVHPESMCSCATCGQDPVTCTCQRRDEYGWHNEGFYNYKLDRLPHMACTASEQTCKAQRKPTSRRPYVPRGDRTYDPPVHTTFAGSRTKPGSFTAQSEPGWSSFEV